MGDPRVTIMSHYLGIFYSSIEKCFVWCYPLTSTIKTGFTGE